MSHYIKIMVAVFVLFLCIHPTRADEEEVIGPIIDHDFSMWNLNQATFPIYKDKVSGYLCALPIFVNDMRDLNPLILRGAVKVNPTEKLSLWAGYDQNSDWTGGKPQFNEHRLWQQVSYSKKLKEYNRLAFNHRFRVEERMFDDGDVAIRLRYQLRSTYSLGKNKKWYGAVSNEALFYANNTPGRNAGFSEDRIYAGIGRKMNDYLTLEIGYQLGMLNRPTNKPDIFRHAVFTSVSFTIPYKKPKTPAEFDKKLPHLVARHDG
jgi:hypothetical protein